ncbi:hybrid sensor histidine kinase/response regulator [Thiocystis violacea]|uniref:hybrid sensor histidine kinase/response regulator n=1 Tax=Thiocystis violacea TaxID=13725 RepID=UPI001905294A|nr:ATP-binding protein [Thiocystis violacea]MBK1721781.1 hypothetical protein [Thiocystis violacea]
MTPRLKALILAVGLTLLMSVLVYSADGYLRLQEEGVLRARIHFVSDEVSHLLDLQALALSRDIFRAKWALLASGLLDPAAPLPSQTALEDLLREHIPQASLLSQLRWLDDKGVEQARVNRVLQADGDWKVSSADQLQDKSSRYYFSRAIKRRGYDIDISALDLNVEFGVVVRPFEPTIRAASPTTRAEGMRPGVLVLNYNLRPLFQRIRSLATQGVDLELVDDRGGWLIHSRHPELEWGRDLGRPANNLRLLDPARYAAIDAISDCSQMALADCQRISLRIDKADAPHLTLVTHATEATLAAHARAKLAALLAVLACAYLAGLGAIGLLYRSDRKLADANLALQHQIERVRVADRHKSRFLANMSHEIRTPIGGVIGLADLLLGTRLTQEQHQLTRTIASDAKLLLGIVNDILDISRIEAGELRLERIEFDLLDLLEGIGATFAIAAEDKGLALVCPANPVAHQWFLGDPLRLRQILANLTANAIKFTEHGEITVRCLSERDETSGATRLDFTVADTGIGIAPEQCARLFERFVQADDSTSRRHGGTGLGLAISKQLVMRMGGTIGVESTPGEGSRFWLRLTLDAVDRPAPVWPATASVATRVLVVQSHAESADFLLRALGMWRIEQAWATSITTALEALSTAAAAGRPFGVALIDQSLEDDERGRLGAARADAPTLAATRLVLMTSQRSYPAAREEYGSDYATFIAKPVCQSRLYNLLLSLTGAADATRIEPMAESLPGLDARVLVAEDTPTNQVVIRAMLHKLGIEPVLAGDGEAALRALAQNPFDLVLMDCQMPILDGYETTRRIRADNLQASGRALPVIAMTANVLEGERERCFAAGMDDYLAKPVEAEALLTTLERWLPEGRRTLVATAPPTPSALPASKAEPPASEPVEALFDPAALSRRVMGDRAIVQTILHAFLGDLPGQLARLEQALAADDLATVAAQAHRIAGAAVNIGATPFGDLALAVEQAARREEPDLLAALTPRLASELARLRAAIEATFD